MINKKQLQANILLFITAFIWGFAFVAQRAGMDHIGPFMFSGIRLILGAVALIPVIVIFDRMEGKNRDQNSSSDSVLSGGTSPDCGISGGAPEKSDFAADRRLREKYTLIGGAICGCVLFVGASMQQIGLVYTSAGKAAFITALYIVLVPIFSVFLKRKLGINAWISAVIAAIGLYLLCIKTDFTIEFGDLIVLIGSVFWAIHILVIDHFVSRVYAVKMSAYQFALAGILSVVVSLFTEKTTMSGVMEAAFPIIFAGIFSCSIAFTLQVVGQKHAAPTTASLILSMEAVFGAIGGFLLLGELLTIRELIGCALMFIAVILSQIPLGTKSKA